MSFFDYPVDAPAAGTTQVFLADASEADWSALLAQCRRRVVDRGQVLISVAEASRSLFLVLDGTVEVMTAGGRLSRPRRLAVVGAGSVIGEQAFFDGGVRSAEVVASTRCEVAELTQSDLAALAQRRPDLAVAVLVDLGRILTQRLRALQAGL